MSYPPQSGQIPYPGRQAVVGASAQRRNPGWPARILFWASILAGRVMLFFLPVMAYGSTFGLAGMRFVSVMITVMSIVAALMAVGALLLVRGTAWVRRLIAVGVVVVTTIVAMVIPWVMTSVAMSMAGGMESALRMQLILGSISSVIGLSGLLIAWCTVRNRVWWILLIAGGLSVVAVVVIGILQRLIGPLQMGYGASNTIMQIASLGLVFGCLGVLHLVGLMPTGTAAVSPPPSSSGSPFAGAYLPVQPDQYPANSYPPNQYGQYPPGQYGQYSAGQYGQNPPNQFGQYPPNQFGQYPPNSYPPNQYGQYPPGQNPPNSYPPNSYPPDQYGQYGAPPDAPDQYGGSPGSGHRG